ncbi:uncharacterized protein LOC132551365 [Ylistrum balloti]|uniref:uncharacterized protein LOC132551365 n=1 Tax=Ylistrum balloti TaxID=509963 RepID=UPI002905BF76|nr:uncharacterized protein LOC132551365 [Ylistrum balloti]
MLIKVVLLLLCGISSLHGGVWDGDSIPPEGIRQMCASNITKKTSVACDYSSREIDWQSTAIQDGECKLNVEKNSLQYFKRTFNHRHFDFAKLLLKFKKGGKPVSVSCTHCVIEPLTWVWTHKAQKSAYKALYWPRDYSILSLGMLERKLYGPYCVFINMKGNCSSLVIGEMNTTLTIVRALSKLIPRKMKRNEFEVEKVPDTNMWCYTKMINMTDTMKLLCRYMICQQDTVGYSCCKHDTRKNTVYCDGQPFRYSKVWWEIPYIIGSILFLFCPLLFIAGSEILYRILRDPKSLSHKPNGQEECEWIAHNHVCFSSVLFSPLRGYVVRHPVAVSRTVRIFISFSTVFVTAIYLIVVRRDYSLRLFLKDLTKNHVPTDVGSMLSGFELSRQNFLTIFGGPYIAFAIFIFLFAALLSVPKSLPILLESGLPDPSPGQLSPLRVDMANKAKLGATESLHVSIGYIKIYKTLVAQMVMLLNPEFWRFVLKCQTGRWVKLRDYLSLCNISILNPVYLITLPLFASLCVFEWFLCLVYYGFPIVFLNVITYRAYCLQIRQYFRGRISKCFTVCFIAIVLFYCSYILHILFVHSLVFLARGAIFTYTGFIAYPEHYRNYLICYLSVAIYVVESVRSMRFTYDELFDKTKLVCDIMMDDEAFEGPSITKKVDSTVFIPQRLFNFVISHHKPLRIETFLILYKLLLTIMIIYISVLLLLIFDTFDNMTLLTEIGTTVVICVAPKALRNMFKSSGYWNEVKERKTIKLWVKDYLADSTSHHGKDKSVSIYVL